MPTKPITTKWGKSPSEAALNVYILYDSSGSMSFKQDEAVSATNAYIRALDPETVATVVAFDSNVPFNVVRDHVAVKDYKDLRVDEVGASGWTPLYDAVTRIISAIQDDKPARAVLVIQTDGQENASETSTLATATQRIQDMAAAGYETIFLGSEFSDVYGQAAGVGVARSKTLNRVAGVYGSASAVLAKHTRGYAVTGQSINFSDAEKASLGDELDPYRNDPNVP